MSTGQAPKAPRFSMPATPVTQAEEFIPIARSLRGEALKCRRGLGESGRSVYSRIIFPSITFRSCNERVRARPTCQRQKVLARFDRRRPPHCMPSVICISWHPRPNFEVCGTAEGATEALQIAADTCPDLAIVDLSLAEGSGLDLIKSLRQQQWHQSLGRIGSRRSLICRTRATRSAIGFVNKQCAHTRSTAGHRSRIGRRHSFKMMR